MKQEPSQPASLATSLSATLLAWWVSCDNHVIVMWQLCVTRFVPMQLIDMFCHLGPAGCVWFAQPDALKGSLVDTLKEAQPTFFFGVPR